MDNKLTNTVKSFALEMGADLVGIANIERYANAPIMMSPQGILPKAKSVVVCAIHHPDPMIELDGEIHPQIMGPYRAQMSMNNKLDYMAFKIARLLDDLGYETIPIASSNIWRYRGYGELTATFAPDISHIYSAVCAGLGELGWNGLCMTPEYGPRNRFVSIITEAELSPTPLYQGEKLCDMCGECINHCPTDAFRKELGVPKDVVIEGKHHIFAGKNLWRCAWAEHFGLDLDLQIPDEVNEQVLLDTSVSKGLRGGEYGVCLKVCLPKHLRIFDSSYNKIGARRKRHISPTDLPLHRTVYDTVLKHANLWDINEVHYISAESLIKAGIDIKSQLPDGNGAILFVSRYNIYDDINEKTYANLKENYKSIAQFNLDFTELDTCRELERFGYSAMPKTYLKHDGICKLCNIFPSSKNEFIQTALVLTSAPIIDKTFKDICNTLKGKDINQQLRKMAYQKGADLVGVASAVRINDLTDQLREIRKNEVLLDAYDTNHRFAPYIPKVTSVKREIKSANDLLPGAKSVIVLGVHYPEAASVRMGKPPAEAVGPYVFTQYEVNRLVGHVGYHITQTLISMGYKALFTYNLTGAGSVVDSPRGLFADAICNTIEAVAAGIGNLTRNGMVYTRQYGINQRFVAVITDAELTEDIVNPGIAKSCENCDICIKACPSRALSINKTVVLKLGDVEVPYLPVEQNRCDWTSRYALSNEDGNIFCGSKTNIPCPEIVNEESLKKALESHDWVFKFRPVIGESCIVNCPLIENNEVI